MFYMLHEVADLFHICKIQWNIMKKERNEERKNERKKGS